jgi:GTP pyrophosphokinase/guanosine-3',5'-bis(diphosphate) 3'-pyrophosphohydrolase
MMELSGDADEFLEYAKLEMFTDQVFTFTPKGDLIALPRGAMPLDFAYAVHTKVGDTCIGALVNGRKHPLRKPLSNGDVVKVIRGGEPEAVQGWENLVITGKARSALRRLTRTGEAEEFTRTGELLAKHAFAREGLGFSDDLITDATKRSNMESVDDLFEALGRGKISMTKFMELVFPSRKKENASLKLVNRDVIDDSTASLYVKGDGLRTGISLHFSECCSPIPGDRIVGLQNRKDDKGGINIHTIDCDTLSSTEIEPENWLDLGWRRSTEQSAATARLTVTVEHIPGALADLTRIIGEADGNLVNIKTVKRSPVFFDMVMDVEVRDKRHLVQIIAALRTSTYVITAERAHGEIIT